ncbi:hypothetical protein U0070_010647, partial [Myodes glareolus]
MHNLHIKWTGPNVLSSVNSEPCYTNVNEMVHIVSQLGTNIIFPSCKIQERCAMELLKVSKDKQALKFTKK